MDQSTFFVPPSPTIRVGNRTPTTETKKSVEEHFELPQPDPSPVAPDFNKLAARIKRLETTAKNNTTYFTRPQKEVVEETNKDAARSRNALLLQYQQQIDKAMGKRPTVTPGPASGGKNSGSGKKGAPSETDSKPSPSSLEEKDTRLSGGSDSKTPDVNAILAKKDDLNNNGGGNNADDVLQPAKFVSPFLAAEAGKEVDEGAAQAFSEMLIQQLNKATTMTHAERLHQRNNAAAAAIRERNERGLVTVVGYKPLQNPATVPVSEYVSAQMRLLKHSLDNGFEYHKHFSRHCDHAKEEKQKQREAIVSASDNVDYVHANMLAVADSTPQQILEEREDKVKNGKERSAIADGEVKEWFTSQAELRSYYKKEEADGVRPNPLTSGARGRALSQATCAKDSDMYSMVRSKWLTNCILARSFDCFGAVMNQRMEVAAEKQRRREELIALREKMTPQQMSRAWTLLRKTLRAYVIRYKNRKMNAPVALLARFLKHHHRTTQLVRAIPQYVEKVKRCQRQVRVYFQMRRARLVILHLQYLAKETKHLNVPNHALTNLVAVPTEPYPDPTGAFASLAFHASGSFAQSATFGAASASPQGMNDLASDKSLYFSPPGRFGGGGNSSERLKSPSKPGRGGNTGAQEPHLTAQNIQQLKDQRAKQAGLLGKKAVTVTEVPWTAVGRDGQGTDFTTRHRLLMNELSLLLKKHAAELVRYQRDFRYYVFEKHSFELKNLAAHGVRPPVPPKRPVFHLLTSEDSMNVLVRLGISSTKISDVSPAPSSPTTAAIPSSSLGTSASPQRHYAPSTAAPPPRRTSTTSNGSISVKSGGDDPNLTTPPLAPLQPSHQQQQQPSLPRRNSIVKVVDANANEDSTKNRKGSRGRRDTQPPASGESSTKSEDEKTDDSVEAATLKLLNASKEKDKTAASDHSDDDESLSSISGFSNPKTKAKAGGKRSKKRKSKGPPKLKTDAQYAAMLKQPSVGAMKKFLMTEGGELGDNRPYALQQRDQVKNPMKLSMDSISGVQDGIKRTAKQSDFDTPVVRRCGEDFSAGVDEDQEAKTKQLKEASRVGRRKSIMDTSSPIQSIPLQDPAASPLRKAAVPRRPLVPPRAPAAAPRHLQSYRRPQATLAQSELLLFHSEESSMQTLNTGLIRKVVEPQRPNTTGVPLGQTTPRGMSTRPVKKNEDAIRIRTPRGTATATGIMQSKGRIGLGGASVFHPSMSAGGNEVASILDSLHEQRVAVSLKKQARSHLS